MKTECPNCASERAAREAAVRERDFLAKLVGSALVLATLDPNQGEAPAEEPTHALTQTVMDLVRARAAAEASAEALRLERDEEHAQVLKTCQRWTEQVTEIAGRLQQAMPDSPAGRDPVDEAVSRLASAEALRAKLQRERERAEKAEKARDDFARLLESIRRKPLVLR